MIDILTATAFLVLVAGVFIVRALVVSWRGMFDAQLAADMGRGYTPTDPIFGDFTEPLAAIPTSRPTADLLPPHARPSSPATPPVTPPSPCAKPSRNPPQR
jgi:hypothetical protein